MYWLIMSFLSKLAISGYTPCSFSDTDIWNMSQLMAHHWRTGAASRDCRRGRSHWLTLSGSTGDFCGFNGDCEDLKLHGTLPPFFGAFNPRICDAFPWSKTWPILIYFIPIQCLRVTGHRQPDHQPVMFTPVANDFWIHVQICSIFFDIRFPLMD